MSSVMRKKGARSRAELAYLLATAEPADQTKDGGVTP